MKKAILAIALAVLLLFAGTFSVGYFQLGFTIDEKVYAENVHVNATLLENGDIHIEETITFRYKNRLFDWWNFYRTFNWDEIENITDISVYDHDYQEEYSYVNTYVPTSYPQEDTPVNTCYLVEGAPYIVRLRSNDRPEEQIQRMLKELEEDGDELYWEIGFNFPAIEKGTRTFTLSYTLCGVQQIEKYADADVLYFKFVQEDTYPIKNFSMDLHFPNSGTADDLTAWLHCKAPGTLTIQDDETISIVADHIAGDEYLEVRLLMPPASLQSAPRQHISPIRADIIQQEDTEAAAWLDTQRYQLFLVTLSLVCGLLIIVAACGFVLLQKHLDSKTIPNAENAEYKRQIPYAVSPAVAGYFPGYVGNRTKEDALQNMVAASTLNLAQKGWLLLTQEAKAGKSVKQLHIKPTEGQVPMSGEEEVLYRLYQKVAKASGGRFTKLQYASYVKKEYRSVKAAMQNYFATAKRSFHRQGWAIRLGFFTSFCGWLCLAFLALAVALILWFSFFGRSVLITGLFVGAVPLCYGAFSRTRLTRKGRVAYTRWMGLRRYLKEATLIDERDPQEVSLWGDYLVYGTALGAGNNVSVQLAHLTPKALGDVEQEQAQGSFAPGRAFMSGHAFTPGHTALTPDTIVSLAHAQVGGGGFAFAAMAGNLTGVVNDMHSIGKTLGTVTHERLVASIRSGGGGGYSSGSSGGGSSSSSFSGGGGGGGGGSSGFR